MAVEEARDVLDAEGAQDAAQEATLRAWRRSGQCRDAGAPEAWVRVIARREALRLARAHSRDRPLEDADDHLRADEGTLLRLELGRALLRLPPGDRELLVRRYWQDLSCAQLAEHFEIPLATAKVRLHRARARLRLQLDARGLGPEA